MLKGEYEIVLLQGNHGIWLFVKQYNKLIIEQSGIKTLDDALKFAKAVIEETDKAHPEVLEIDSGN